MDILSLHRRGISRRRIALKLGISRNTVKKFIDHPTFSNQQRRKRPSKLDPYREHIVTWLDEDMQYTATWIFDRLKPMGFTGSYEIVKRCVSRIKKERSKVAYMRFETEPGFQAQVDFGEFQIENANGKVEKLYLFTMILGYSRKIYGEFIDCCDLPHFLDCHIHAFEFFGGVPEQILYDRMKNVYIGKLAGKAKFNDALMGLALHYGFTPMVAPACSPWVKGKVERPYTFIREGFWRGYGYINQDTANAELRDWLAEKDMRIHGTTHEVINDRYNREALCLTPLPKGAIDTSYRIFREVHKDCTVRFDCNSFVVPHKLVGERVVLRVKDGKMRIFHDNYLVVTYRIPEGKGELVQDKRFYDALRKDREMNQRKYGSGRRLKGRAKRTISPKKPPHEIMVDIRHLRIYELAMERRCVHE